MKCLIKIAWYTCLMTASIACAEPGSLPYFSGTTMSPAWSDPEKLPGIQRMAGFELQNQQGETFSAAAADGRIRVVNFFFATCPGICPMTMFNLKRVQDAIGGDSEEDAAILLSFSITPNIDSPEKLAAYARAKGIQAGRWQLLTGDEKQITALAADTFFAVLDHNAPTGSLAHTEKAYLLDRAGYIRGVYNATSPADVLRLVEDLEQLR